MAGLRQSRTRQQVLKAPMKILREWYNELATDYDKIIGQETLLCHKCGELKPVKMFYKNENFGTGVFWECKDCIKMEVEQRKSEADTPHETEESIKAMLQKMDKPFIRAIFQNSAEIVNSEESFKTSIWGTYYAQIASLPQYAFSRWKDSDPDEQEEETSTIDANSKKIRDARKHFGTGYSVDDLDFLETEYRDWTERYSCDSKSQEVLFQRICCVQLQINKAHKSNQSTKELDRTLQDLLTSLGIKPSQSNLDAMTESQTFGQLIAKWEEHDPIPEAEGIFADVDKIGLYIEVFFKGHLAKMMGLKNAFSSIYDKFMAKWTVTKPEYDEDSSSEALFEKIFGKMSEDSL